MSPWPLPRSFRLLWLASAISNMGDGVRVAALPLLATSVTSDARLIAGVAIADRLPWLLLILPGGALADRVDRRRLRMTLDLARAMLTAGLVVLVIADRVSIVAIWVVAALLSSMEATVDSSSMALIPSTVDAHDLERAGSRLTSAELVTNGLLGPPLGGLLFGVAVAAPFIIDSVSFAAAAAVIALMSGRYAAHRSSRASMWREIVAGFAWFWRVRLLRNLALIGTALGTVSFIGEAVFVLFARNSLDLSAKGYGLLLVPRAVGGMIGSVIAGRLTNRPLVPVLFTAILLDGIALWTVSGLHSVPLVALLSAVSAAGVITWNVLTLALRQRIIPDELLGRVGASFRFLVYLGMPVGAFAGGLLANSFGVRTALAVDGIAITAIALALPALFRNATANPPSRQPH